MSEQSESQPRERSGLERLLGERPGGLVIRLVVLSLIVGFIMAVLGIDARYVFQSAVRMVEDALRDGTGLLGNLVRYTLAGAALVVPIWIVLRLLKRR
ncbi:hypothetical protein GCM10007913_28830 [Devosia yakushimensis]|uniref:DUF6460 domain-containing protein n=1 Tax=Devosia yakushimensis TaxID=470028 RepID=A0ABQ5UG48_9HYPH|nr:DUF6460 domain-containing protein [Devosia yakushimensis]GLQ10951.1 hypothetical protein GCM10007913_28830 [Devosia yakushimensis]